MNRSTTMIFFDTSHKVLLSPKFKAESNHKDVKNVELQIYKIEPRKKKLKKINF